RPQQMQPALTINYPVYRLPPRCCAVPLAKFLFPGLLRNCSSQQMTPMPAGWPDYLLNECVLLSPRTPVPLIRAFEEAADAGTCYYFGESRRSSRAPVGESGRSSHALLFCPLQSASWHAVLRCILSIS